MHVSKSQKLVSRRGRNFPQRTGDSRLFNLNFEIQIKKFKRKSKATVGFVNRLVLPFFVCSSSVCVLPFLFSIISETHPFVCHSSSFGPGRHLNYNAWPMSHHSFSSFFSSFSSPYSFVFSFFPAQVWWTRPTTMVWKNCAKLVWVLCAVASQRTLFAPCWPAPNGTFSTNALNHSYKE